MIRAMEIIEKLRRIQNINEFLLEMERFLLSFGFECWVYSVKMPDEFAEAPIDEVFHNWNQEFVDRYANIHASYCPRFKHLWRSEAPLIYDSNYFEYEKANWKDYKPEVRTLLEEEIDFGYQGFGFSLSTHGKYGEKGVLTLQNRDTIRKDGIDAISLNFHIVSAFFPFMHMKYIELKGWKPPGSFLELTERELECLRWAAGGKTAWETGMVLNISERTVNFHLVNAQKKLGATNKIQTVARAILYNYL